MKLQICVKTVNFTMNPESKSRKNSPFTHEQEVFIVQKWIELKSDCQSLEK